MADDLWGDLGYKAPAQTSSNPAPKYDPNDLAVRLTMLEEKDPTARKWVAGVMANRAKAKGGDLLGALTEPKAFEPWTSKQKDIAAIDPNSDEYKATAADVLPIIQGKAPDPSGGATHFYAPDAQAQLAQTDGRPAKPEFDDGSGKQVGGTLFFGGKSDPGDLWGQLGYDPKAKADDTEQPGVVAFTGLKEHASKPDSAAYLQLVKGGLIDKDAPEGSEKNPYGIQPGMTEKDVPAGAFYIAGGKLQRAPGGPKESSAVAGLGQGVGDVLTGISHVMPGSDDSDIKNALIGSQMVYGAKYGGDLKSGAGRFTGQLLGSAPLLAGGEAAAVPALTRAGAGPVAEFLAGRGGAAMARGVPRLLARGASLSTAGAEGGGAAAALTSSANEEPLGEQVASGALGGALVGPVAPVVAKTAQGAGRMVRSLVEPMTESGRGKIVNRIIGNFGEGAPLTGDASEIIPGSVPTLGEASGNPGVASLQRTVRLSRPTPFVEREMQNSEARAQFFDNLRGDADTISGLEDAREAATAGARETALKAQSKPADVQPVLDKIDEILKGPEGKRAEVVKALNEVRQNLHDAAGNPETSAEMLYGVRKGIGDLLSPKASSDKRGAQLAASQLMEVKQALDTSIQDVAPGFKEYLKTYADMSKPIDEARMLQSLKVADMRGNITLNRVNTAIQKIEGMRSKPGTNDAKSISDDTLGALKALREDLKRADNINLGRPLGSDTAQHLVTGNIAEHMNVPLAVGVGAIMHHPMVAPAVGVGKLVLGKKNEKLVDELANRLLDPNAGARAIVAPKAPGKIARTVGRLTKPLLPASGGLIANRLVTQ